MSYENWERWDYYFKLSGEKWNVDWRWLKAIAMNESSLGTNRSVKIGLDNPKNVAGSVSSDGLSYGLMQVTLKTAKDMDPSITAQKLNVPEYSIDLAARYISQLKKMFSITDLRYVEWVIKSYNAGGGAIKKQINNPTGLADEYWRRFKNNLDIITAYQ